MSYCKGVFTWALYMLILRGSIHDQFCSKATMLCTCIFQMDCLTYYSQKRSIVAHKHVFAYGKKILALLLTFYPFTLYANIYSCWIVSEIQKARLSSFFFFFFFFFYSQKTINTLVKSQYISIHLVSFSRVKWQWITSILLLQNITIAQTYQISIHVDYMFSTCWYTLGTNTFSTCCNNPKKY